MTDGCFSSLPTQQISYLVISFTVNWPSEQTAPHSKLALTVNWPSQQTGSHIMTACCPLIYLRCVCAWITDTMNWFILFQNNQLEVVCSKNNYYSLQWSWSGKHGGTNMIDDVVVRRIIFLDLIIYSNSLCRTNSMAYTL